MKKLTTIIGILVLAGAVAVPVRHPAARGGRGPLSRAGRGCGRHGLLAARGLGAELPARPGADPGVLPVARLDAGERLRRAGQPGPALRMPPYGFSEERLSLRRLRPMPHRGNVGRFTREMTDVTGFESREYVGETKIVALKGSSDK